MTLLDGQSELDSIVLRLPDEGIELKKWESYEFTQNFLVPTATWSFTVSPEIIEPGNLPAGIELPPGVDVAQLKAGGVSGKSFGFVLGSKVEISMNDRLQCTGFIERITTKSSPRGGTLITVQGRDILGDVVVGCIDPSFKFTAGTTLHDAIMSVLHPFGIDTIYTTDDLNISVITGRPKGETTSRKVETKVPKRVVKPDGTVDLQYQTVKTTVVESASTRRDLKTVQINQIKPRMGEGVFAFLDRILRRFGLMMWAAADGSGVVVAKPDFDTSKIIHRIVHRANDFIGQNNVLSSSIARESISQPSVIVGFGTGGGQSVDKARHKVIMANELVSYDVDDEGNIVEIPIVGEIKARYKGAKVLPPRKELQVLEFLPKKRPAPMFTKDDESQTIEQLENYVRREMAEHQQKSLVATYELAGHTFNGHPWAMNTMVDMHDSVGGVVENMWVLEKTFKKSRAGGTTTTLKLIRPHTLALS